MDSSNLFNELCSYNNLELAFKKTRKGKTLKHYVIEFENNLKQNLLDLRIELLFHAYRPKSLKTFIVRDPKTRKISKSDFRDRIVHHAICNILEPIYEKIFIHDTYANRKRKGTLAAVKRFDEFKRKVTENNTRSCYVLKADIKHYFEEVDKGVLINMIKRRITDERVISLIQIILDNFNGQMGGGNRPQRYAAWQFNEPVFCKCLSE